MTKHAVNAFLATSVTFINELAALCERTGADAKEVERGLKTERRIGPHAYLSPGGAFAGGTLARDVTFLRQLGSQTGRPTPLMDGVLASNTAHRMWAQRRLESELGDLAGAQDRRVGSHLQAGHRHASPVRADRTVPVAASVRAPRCTSTTRLRRRCLTTSRVTRHDDPLAAAAGARALVVATGWPAYREVDVDRLAAVAPQLLVLDANRFLGPILANDPRFRLVAVGQPQA